MCESLPSGRRLTQASFSSARYPTDIFRVRGYIYMCASAREPSLYFWLVASLCTFYQYLILLSCDRIFPHIAKTHSGFNLIYILPPAPPDLNVSHLMAPSLISTSNSSASGSTATVAAEVCTRPCVSVAGTRCTRCTPLSYFITP